MISRHSHNSLFIVRDYKEDDFVEVNQLWEDTGMGGAFRGDTKDVVIKCLSRGGKLFILKKTTTHEIVGTSWLTDDGRRLYLHHFGIKPAFQGKGLSHKLVKASLDYANQQKMQIKLEVHQKNAAALSLYKKYGFKSLGDYDVYIIRDF